jgi:hypothetical protein
VISENDTTKVIVRYPNQSGALIEVTESFGFWFGALRTVYGARCTACLDTAQNATSIGSPRQWAQNHSEACRALPQHGTTAQ